MCICLPNGKFNFKFTRSHHCSGKKNVKSKRTLSLISESSEEDEGRDKLSFNYNNGTKKDIFSKVQADCANNQGHIRQLSRDRQLPPVPDTIDFNVLQINSPRKSVKNSTNSIISGQRPYVDDYGNVYDTEAYAESKAAVASSSTKQHNQFPMTVSEDVREIDPLYSSVHLQANKQRCQGQKNDVATKELYCTKIDNDHLYSTIVKKDFNSLRKPSRPRSSIKDYPYQSLQSLNNQAPGLPVRLYKLSELSHLTNHVTIPDSEVKLRKNTPQNSISSSLRRFSQPNSISNENEHAPQISEESQRDSDVLRRIQSQYNTPPVKRASLSDVRQLHLNINNESPINEGRHSSGIIDDIPSPTGSHSSVTYDHYRHVTVRESLASLRARNALPENSLLFESSLNAEPRILPHVYEGLYETLYYSSAEPNRPDPVPEVDPNILPLMTPEPPNPLPYLGQDNYLSITENPLSGNFHGQGATATTNVMSRQSQDRSSVIYATTGSEVYAEISDAYLSKQYEELPEQKPNNKESGQVNNGYIGSPGTLRVLLEIQSFRHMDSDVDVSSRSTTPLHPLARSITSIGKPTTSILNNNHHNNNNNNNAMPYPSIIRHPWFLPQRSTAENTPSPSSALSSSSSFKTPITAKPKPIQNHLAIMTPLMERSMEGSSMFLDDNRNAEHHEVDNLYDLFKVDRSNGTILIKSNNKPATQKQALAKNEEENDYCNKKNKRIVYPSFSNNHVSENGDRNHRFL